MINNGLAALAALLLASGTATAEPERSWLRARASASAWLSSFDGELQTPLGGRAGTTSSGRPDTREVGLAGLDVYPLADLELRLLGQHTFHLSYVFLEQSGEKTLDRKLVSHGQTFPHNARVNSHLELPFGRIGYRADWLPLAWGEWKLAPEIGAVRLDFRYRLRSKAATGEADRDYVLYFAYWGARIEGPVHGRLRATFDLLASAGLSNVTSIDSDLRLLYPVFEGRWVTASVTLGLRGIWIRYKDDQDEEQNDIDVRMGAFSRRPWAGVHLGLHFEH
ncbi:MAG: hypothetical protein GY944_06695 [bacterium]|nr:hypothetical protein [bacterium]